MANYTEGDKPMTIKYKGENRGLKGQKGNMRAYAYEGGLVFVIGIEKYGDNGQEMTWKQWLKLIR